MPEYLAKYNRNIPDIGHDETEEVLSDMIAEVESVYGQAYDEIKQKADAYFSRFIEEDTAKRKQMEDGVITKENYSVWRRTHILTGQWWYAMAETMSDNLANANGIALSIINGYMPEVYAINGNWTAYVIEKTLQINTAFTMFDEQTVERLIREIPDLLPHGNIDIPADKRWNKQKMVSAVTQGIIQGEDVYQLAERLAAVTDMNERAAIRNAATMTTSAENGGRMDGYRRALAMGINLKHRWLATLDGHTRDSHRRIDGDVVEVGEKFANGCEYPGDPNGRPEEVYNCRCKTIAAFEDQDFSKFDRISRLGDMSYDAWKTAHGGEPLFRSARNVNRDMRMYDEYVSLLGKTVPKTFRSFRDLKYKSPDRWSKMKSDARKARNAKRKSGK